MINDEFLKMADEHNKLLLKLAHSISEMNLKLIQNYEKRQNNNSSSQDTCILLPDNTYIIYFKQNI